MGVGLALTLTVISSPVETLQNVYVPRVCAAGVTTYVYEPPDGGYV